MGAAKGYVTGENMSGDWNKIKNMKNEIQTDTLVLCDCEEAKNNVAYDTGGCLRCTVQDCSFFVYNFTDSIATLYAFSSAS